MNTLNQIAKKWNSISFINLTLFYLKFNIHYFAILNYLSFHQMPAKQIAEVNP